MVKIERFKRPEFYSSTKFKEYKHSIAQFYHTYRKNDQRFLVSLPRRFELLREIRSALSKNFNNKCAYCESITEGDVDQFRPSRGARNLNKESSDIHYWWLTSEWDNQYLSCAICNRNKGNWFPVEGPRCKSEIGYPEVYEEINLLVDPCIDDPSVHLVFSSDGSVNPRTKIGEVTINILKLNRRELVSMRKDSFDETMESLRGFPVGRGKKLVTEPLKTSIKSILNGKSKLSHLAMRRLAIHEANLIDYKPVPILRSLRNSETDIRYTEKKIKTVKNCYVSSFQINNFKSIKSLNHEVSQVGANDGLAPWTVFLGENGLGKSSILQAICLSLIDPNYFNKFITGDKIINNKSVQGSVKSIFDDQSSNSIKFSSNSRISSDFEVIPNYVIAYGSTRLSQQKNLKLDGGTKYFKVQNLFDHTAAIRNAEKWLLTLKNENSFTSAARIIKLALVLDNSYRLSRDQKRVFFIRGNSKILIEQMSDGFKSSISLIVDIMSVLNKGMDNFEDIEGIVFIDELELHLHPRWKMKYIQSFRKAFPKIQVFATTHDPLCLKGLYKGEIVLLQENRNAVRIIADLPDVASLKAEQILTSEFFGLSSTLDPDEEAKFNKYYFLLAKPKPSLADKKLIKALRKELPPTIQLGDSLRDDLLLSAVDTIVAKQFKTKDFKSREALKQTTQDFVLKLLKSKK